MTMFRGSRYRRVGSIQTMDADRNVEAVLQIRRTSLDIPVGSRQYVTQAGDTFESLAYREYGDGNKGYVLADVNPQIFWPLELPPGTRIMIPPRSYAELV